jgi:RNA polymerase sigma factor, sigma-70 family
VTDEAFDTFIQKYRPIMKKIANLYVNSDDAEDVVQNVCIKLHKHRDKLAEIENIDNWLFYVVRNHCYDDLRQRKSKSGNISYEYNADYIDTIFKDDDIIKDYIRQERNQAVKKCVDELPDGIKLPVLLYYFEDMSVDEVAKTLDMPTTTVKWRLNSARVKLKTKIIKGDIYYE